MDINKLFLPHKSIREEKNLFAGRRELILQALEEIQMPGKSLIVFGERGIGKTSIAWQLYDLLSKDFSLLEYWGIKRYRLNKKYGVLYYQCTKRTRSLEGVLIGLFTHNAARTTIPAKYPKLLENNSFKKSINVKLKLDLGFIGAALDWNEKSDGSGEVDLIGDQKAKIHAFFEEAVAHLKRDYGLDELVIIIDEFNQLPDKTGIGDLISDSSGAKFVLVGISDNIEEIVEDNPDVVLKLYNSSHKVPNFIKPEVDWIFDNAEGHYPSSVKFKDDYREEMMLKSDGLPWIIQTLGHASLKFATKKTRNGIVILNKALLLDSVIGMVEKNPVNHKLEKIIKGDHSLKIELLEAIAESGTIWTSVESIKDKVTPKMRHWIPKNMDELVAQNILKRDKKGLYRFSNPIDRIYVQIRK